jgi:MYXO-CTERM domain-containing protein
MARRILQTLTKGLLAATLIGALSGAASAQVEPNRTAPPAPAESRREGSNWGLLGLLGLAGLAGLIRRGDVKDYRTDRPPSGTRT